MPDSIVLNTKTVNITLAYEGNVLALAKELISDVRNQLITSWGGTVDPIVTQLPNLIAFILPQNQFSCVFDHQNRIILSNQELTSFEARQNEIDKLIAFLFRLQTIFPITLKAYGFNYTIECEKEGLGALIKTFFDNNKLQSIRTIVGGEPEFIEAGFMLVYKNADFQTNVRVSPMGVPNKYQIDGNVNHNSATLPEFAQLKKAFTSGFIQLASIVDSLE